MVTVDFKTFGGENRGVYYQDSGRIVIFLSNHESLDDVYKTVQHEVLHHAIAESDQEMDEDQEHRLIFAISWADLSLE